MKRIIIVLLVILNVKSFSQNVGIGTTTPLSKLHVAGAIRSDTLIYVGPGVRSLFAAPNGRIYDSLVIPSTLNWEVNGNSNITPARFLGTTNANDVIFKTNNIERARILSTGNVGVGIAAPVEKLHVNGNILSEDGTYPQSSYNVGYSASTVISDIFQPWTDNGIKIYDGNSLSHLHIEAVGPCLIQAYGTAGSPKASLENTSYSALALQDKGGDVGIGTINPANRLEIRSAAANTSGLRFTNLTAASPTIASNGKALSVDANGDVVLVSSASNAWDLLGNAGTTAGTNFLGTTDAQDMVIKTNNLERVRTLASNGFVGVGITSPTAPLDVNNAVRASSSNPLFELNGTFAPIPNLATIAIRSAGEVVQRSNTNNAAIVDWEMKYGYGTSTAPIDAFYVGRRTAPANPLTYFMLINSAGNVGVGTTTPANKVEITSATANTSGLRLTNLTSASPTIAATGKALSVDANGDVVLVPALSDAWLLTGNAGTTGGTNFLGTTDAQPLVVKTNNTEAVRVLPNGNVGIGTTAPAARLDVGEVATSNVLKSVLARLPEGNNTGVGTYLGVRAFDTQPISINSFAIEHRFYGSLNGSINFYRGGTNGDGFMTFATNGGLERMRITVGGDIGIGTPTPGNKVEIRSATANTSGLRFTNLTSASTTVAANGKALSVDANGDVVLVSAASNAWTLLGNGGTTAGTNFLGTTDAQDLVIKTNNTEKVRVLSNGQVGIGTNAPSASAIVQIVSTTQGVQFPSMTSTQRLAIAAPAAGLMVYDVTANILMSYNGTRWQEVGGDPIGSIEAFHKSMPGTPVLPWGWVECNGQVIADAESPYNGQAVPLLNSNGKFLRGSTTSGTMQTEDVGTHTHTGGTSAAGGHNHGGSTGSVNSTNGRVVPWDDNLSTNKMNAANTGQLIDTPPGGGGTPWDGLATVGNFLTTIDQLDHTHVINAEGNHTHAFTTNANTGTETRPTNMSVVWIIRIK